MYTEQLEDLKQQLLNDRPVKWEDFPDIDLYMDQLINYMPRQQIVSRPENKLTSAMVNNYIKVKLLERANGKKYSRAHLAELTIICFLKQIVSVKDAAFLFSKFSKNEVESLYEHYIEDLDKSLIAISEQIPDSMDDDQMARTAMHFAITSYAYKQASLRLVDILQEREEQKKPAKKAPIKGEVQQ